MKRFVLVLLLLCLSWIVILTACNSEPSSDHTFAGATYTEPIEIPNFTLTGADGPVSLDDFAGQYVFAYFGYTFCPDVCPATLAELARVREQLGDEADKVQVLMVTVDPERDTPQKRRSTLPILIRRLSVYREQRRKSIQLHSRLAFITKSTRVRPNRVISSIIRRGRFSSTRKGGHGSRIRLKHAPKRL